MPITRLHSSSDLREEFRAYGRQSTFSAQAYDWLWDYLEQLEDDTGTSVEVDVVGLCCDYSEESYDTIASLYSIELPVREEFMVFDDTIMDYRPDMFDALSYRAAKREAILDYLRENTVVLGYDDDSVLYAAF